MLFYTGIEPARKQFTGFFALPMILSCSKHPRKAERRILSFCWAGSWVTIGNLLVPNRAVRLMLLLPQKNKINFLRAVYELVGRCFTILVAFSMWFYDRYRYLISSYVMIELGKNIGLLETSIQNASLKCTLLPKELSC